MLWFILLFHFSYQRKHTWKIIFKYVSIEFDILHLKNFKFLQISFSYQGKYLWTMIFKCKSLEFDILHLKNNVSLNISPNFPHHGKYPRVDDFQVQILWVWNFSSKELGFSNFSYWGKYPRVDDFQTQIHWVCYSSSKEQSFLKYFTKIFPNWGKYPWKMIFKYKSFEFDILHPKNKVFSNISPYFRYRREISMKV